MQVRYCRPQQLGGLKPFVISDYQNVRQVTAS